MTIRFPHVVLADDDDDDRDFFCAGMERIFPYIGVFTFKDGEELFEYLNTAAPDLPDCIFLDYKMPRLTAPQFLRRTGEGTRYSEVPKIVWSTSQRQKDIDECLGLGAVRFIVKPETDGELDTVIRSLECWIYRHSRTAIWY